MEDASRAMGPAPDNASACVIPVAAKVPGAAGEIPVPTAVSRNQRRATFPVPNIICLIPHSLKIISFRYRERLSQFP